MGIYEPEPHDCTPTTDCGACDGTGLTYRGFPEEQDCEFCNGTGGYAWCAICGRPANEP